MKHLKFLSLLLTLCMLLTGLYSCSWEAKIEGLDEIDDTDIVILFTNDIHCYLEGNVTLSKISAYKKYLETMNDKVLLVDCGDAVQGSTLGTVSEGDILIDAMNAAGYDYAIFGNHEFDYGQERLIELVTKANAQYLCCNITYTGTGETALTQSKPYEIVTFGDKKVALIGVTTPLTLSSCTPAYFMEDGEYVYDFCGGTTNEALIACVQKNVDSAREEGADYVIVMSHLGNDSDSSIFSSELLIEGTTGIDAVLDAHSHETYTKVCVESKDGKLVPLAQTGTALANLGQLVITDSGVVTVTLIDELTKDDETVKEQIEGYVSVYSEKLNEVVAYSNVALSDKDEYGVRALRNQETGIGNLVADSYRAALGADIAYINGGGIRSGIPAGDITYQDIINVQPFGNMLCLVEVTGQEVLDMLEYFVRNVQPETVSQDLKNAVGEDGSFPSVSGLTFTADTTIESPVVVDENEMFLSIDETKTRRVSNVMVESGDTYVPIDVNKTYTLASHDYMILNGGSGMLYFLKDHNVVMKNVIADYQALINYIVDDLKGDLSSYGTPTIKRDTFVR